MLVSPDCWAPTPLTSLHISIGKQSSPMCDTNTLVQPNDLEICTASLLGQRGSTRRRFWALPAGLTKLPSAASAVQSGCQTGTVPAQDWQGWSACCDTFTVPSKGPQHAGFRHASRSWTLSNCLLAGTHASCQLTAVLFMVCSHTSRKLTITLQLALNAGSITGRCCAKSDVTASLNVELTVM